MHFAMISRHNAAAVRQADSLSARVICYAHFLDSRIAANISFRAILLPKFGTSKGELRGGVFGTIENISPLRRRITISSFIWQNFRWSALLGVTVFDLTIF